MRTHPAITQIAAKYGKSPAQVLYRWRWQQNIVIQLRTRNPTHMIENLSIFDFEPDLQDMMTLSYMNHPKLSKVCGDPRLTL